MHPTRRDNLGYNKETADMYTAGQDRFFNIDKVEDGATIAMADRIRTLSRQNPPHTLVDIGCGSTTGYLKLWRECSRAQLLIGVEPSARMRELLQKDIPAELKNKLQISSGDWLNTGLDADTADIVVSRFSLHHIKNISDGYRELKRVLKHKSHAVISLPHPDFCKKILEDAGVKAIEGAPMEVRVFDVNLHYFLS